MGSYFSSFSFGSKKKKKPTRPSARSQGSITISLDNNSNCNFFLNNGNMTNNFFVISYPPTKSPINSIRSELRTRSTTQSNIKKLALTVSLAPQMDSYSIPGFRQCISKGPVGITAFLCATKDSGDIKSADLHTAYQFMKKISFRDFEKFAKERFDRHVRKLKIEEEYFNVIAMYGYIKNMSNLDFIRFGFALGFSNQAMYIMNDLDISVQTLINITRDVVDKISNIYKYEFSHGDQVMQLIE
eukprot:UN11041